jgi:3-oxoacyl-[acyl-carrier protein] reductase
MGNLDGRTAIITGAGQGIGRAVALRLASSGVGVLLADINLETVRTVEQEISGDGGRAVSVQADISDAAGAEAVVKLAVESFGGLDILVNNAGITRDGLLLRLKPEDLDQVLSVNLKGAFYTCRAASRVMMKARSGSIINMSSIIGLMGNVGQTTYAASKAGLIGLTKSLARELASRGVRVNAVAPGFIETAMTEALPEETRQEMLAGIPLARFGKPEDVADLVHFLASDNSGYITGQVVVVDGGMLM